MNNESYVFFFFSQSWYSSWAYCANKGLIHKVWGGIWESSFLTSILGWFLKLRKLQLVVLVFLRNSNLWELNLSLAQQNAIGGIWVWGGAFLVKRKDWGIQKDQEIGRQVTHKWRDLTNCISEFTAHSKLTRSSSEHLLCLPAQIGTSPNLFKQSFLHKQLLTLPLKKKSSLSTCLLIHVAI